MTSRGTPHYFDAWFEAQLEKYGSAQALADQVGISLSALLRAAKGRVLSVELCLKLARETGDDPSALLRLGGKHEAATLIEALYGKPQKLRGSAARAFEAINGLEDEGRDLLTRIARRLKR